MQALRVKAIGFAMLIAAAAIGMVWLSIAAVQWLTDISGPAAAPLLVGLFLLAPLALYVLAKRDGEDGRDETPTPPQHEGIAPLLLNGAKTLFQRRPLAAIGLAVTAGLIVIRYPGIVRLGADMMRRPPID